LCLTAATLDANTALDGFHLIWADRIVESGKKSSGGLAMFVSDRGVTLGTSKSSSNFTASTLSC